MQMRSMMANGGLVPHKNRLLCVQPYPAPERAVDTDGDCGGVPPTSFPYGPADGGVGDDRMLELTPIASSESTAVSQFEIRYVK